MPRKATLKGLQSITRHNIIKYLDKQKLTKKEYNKVIKLAEEYLSKASHDDLKQKGIVQKIINGGMKRPNDGEDKDEPEYKRTAFEKFRGFFRGDPLDDQLVKLKNSEKATLEFSEKVRIAKNNYEVAKRRTEKAKRDEEIALKRYELVQSEKEESLESTTNFLRNKPHLIQELEKRHTEALETLSGYERKITEGQNWNSYRDNLIKKIISNNEIYFRSTGKYLPNSERFMMGNVSASSSSASLSQPALAQPEPQLALQPGPQQDGPVPVPAPAQAPPPEQPPIPPPAPLPQEASSSSAQLEDIEQRRQRLQERRQQLQQQQQRP